MNVSAQPDVIGQVVAWVIGIVIDHDVIIVPEPAVRVVVIIGRDLEEKTANVESIKTAAAQTPNVPRPKAGSEVSVLPRMIKMIVRVIAARIVANPAVVFSMHVGSFRMTCLIVIPGVILFRTPLLRRLRTTIGILLAGWHRAAFGWCGRGAACRNVSIADAVFSAPVLSIALRLLCVCLHLLTVLLASALGQGGDRCQQ